MTLIRALVGVIISCMLLASSAAHSLLGWPPQKAELVAARASPYLISRLAMGWHFAGMAMFVFGAIAVYTFVMRLRRRPVSLWPVWLVAAGYIAYGAAALALQGGDAFFLFTFLMPGILLGLAAWPDAGPRLAS